MRSISNEIRRLIRLLSISLPVVIVAGARIALYLTDVWAIESALSLHPASVRAALAWSLSLYWCLGALLVAVGFGVWQWTERQLEGERGGCRAPDDEREGFEAPLNHGIVLVSGLALLGMLAGWAAAPALLARFAPTEAVAGLGRAYVGTRLLGLLPLGLFFAFDGALDALRRRHYVLLGASVTVGVNAILTPIATSGAGPFPPMGASGAAMGSVLATLVGGLTVAVTSLSGLDSLRVARFRFEYLKIHKLGRLLRTSLPVGMVGTTVAVTMLVLLGGLGVLEGASIQLAPFDTWPSWRPNAEWTGLALLDLWPAAMLQHLPPVGTAALVVIVELLVPGLLLAVGLGRGGLILERESREALGSKGVELRRAILVGAIVVGGWGGLLYTTPTRSLALLIDAPLVVQLAAPGLSIVASLQVLIVFASVLMRARPILESRSPRLEAACELSMRAFTLSGGLYATWALRDLHALGIWGGAVVYLVVLTSWLLWLFEGRDEGTPTAREIP